MKKQSSSLSHWLPPVKLFRNDLDEILLLFKQTCKEVKISNNKFDFDDYDDVKENLGNKIKKIKITGITPDVSMEIGFGLMNDDVNISTSGNTPEAKALFYEVKNYMQDRLLLVSRLLFFDDFLWKVLPFAFILAVFATYNKIVYVSMVIILSVWIVAVILHIVRRRGSVIYLEHERNISFWKVNKDKIITGFIIAFFGAILGIIGTLLVKKYITN